MSISNLQLALLAGNFIVSATIVSVPQALIDLSMQNTWIIPPLIFGYIIILINLALWGFKKIDNYQEVWEANNFLAKGTALLILVFLFHILAKDLRTITAFTKHVLLPLTPDFVITMLFVFSILYLAWAGIEVIARFTELYFLYLIGVFTFLPLSLIPQIEFYRFEPVLGFQTIPSILQAVFVGLAPAGELIAFVIVITMVKPIGDAKRSFIIGGAIGMFLLTIIIFSQISVLSSDITRFSLYPSYQLVQQVRLTEFLDRLDLVIVAFYYPSVFAKMAFSLYGIHRCLEIILNQKSKLHLVPLALLTGIVSIAFFKNAMHNYNFEIFTWATLGLMLEILIAFMFALMLWRTRKNQKSSSAEQSAAGQQSPGQSG
ncbi:spore germination protein [Evansella sp. LMS18]|uniref:GerAB/ArcD/ProY family transporter n=1 Tax=Evansella sp. LMS18 TaxID=2924033 RepID=UPI0020D01F41|nr:GerAB/ArcD/ProY family transporter [Evansella sp. LMS18]UTR11865.1 spore germination protein [Evansella sp. LMS18]